MTNNNINLNRQSPTRHSLPHTGDMSPSVRDVRLRRSQSEASSETSPEASSEITFFTLLSGNKSKAHLLDFLDETSKHKIISSVSKPIINHQNFFNSSDVKEATELYADHIETFFNKLKVNGSHPQIDAVETHLKQTGQTDETVKLLEYFENPLNKKVLKILFNSDLRLSDEELSHYINHPNRRVTRILAESSYPLSNEQITTLLKDISPHIRSGLAKSERPLNFEQVNLLFHDADERVRAALAGGTQELTDNQIDKFYANDRDKVKIALLAGKRPLSDARIIETLRQDGQDDGLGFNPVADANMALIASGRAFNDTIKQIIESVTREESYVNWYPDHQFSERLKSQDNKPSQRVIDIYLYQDVNYSLKSKIIQSNHPLNTEEIDNFLIHNATHAMPHYAVNALINNYDRELTDGQIDFITQVFPNNQRHSQDSLRAYNNMNKATLLASDRTLTDEKTNNLFQEAFELSKIDPYADISKAILSDRPLSNENIMSILNDANQRYPNLRERRANRTVLDYNANACYIQIERVLCALIDSGRNLTEEHIETLINFDNKKIDATLSRSILPLTSEQMNRILDRNPFDGTNFSHESMQRLKVIKALARSNRDLPDDIRNRLQNYGLNTISNSLQESRRNLLR